jgi:hypothetical protein
VGGSNQSDVSDDGDSHFRRADEGSTNRTYTTDTAGSVKLFLIKKKVFFFNYTDTAHGLMAFSQLQQARPRVAFPLVFVSASWKHTSHAMYINYYTYEFKLRKRETRARQMSEP